MPSDAYKNPASAYPYEPLPAHDPREKHTSSHEQLVLASSLETGLGAPAAASHPSLLRNCCRRLRRPLLRMLALVSLFALGASVWATLTPDIGVPQREIERWAQYAPYYALADYAAVPSGCAVAQVNLLQRHGARWPTSSAGMHQAATVAKLQAVADAFADPRLDFLRGFVYDFGADDLLPYGALQSQDAGAEAYARYVELMNETSVPFVRAASSQRVVDSASNWTIGVSAASDYRVVPVLDVVISEDGNITLDDAMCPNQSDGTESASWLALFAPSITARLNAAAPGANLTDADTLNLMDLCPFHSIVEERPSPFCALFEAREFEDYEYYYDLDKYYGTGYGNALGPVQGVGYINELLARLTGTPVRDSTQTNRTLDADPATFPLGRAFYADFSHDNEMVAIYAAMGLFRPRAPLDPDSPSPSARRRAWVNSRIVPFAARMVVEKVACASRGEFVRVLVGDEVQPLAFCGAGRDGMCKLDAFVESQKYAREDGQGDWEKCGWEA